MKNAQIIKSINAAYAYANGAYIARSKTPNIDPKTKLNPDIARGLKTWQMMSDAQTERLTQLSIDFARVSKYMRDYPDTKNLLRTPMFLSFVATQDPAHLKGSARTALLGFGLALLKVKTRAGLITALSGKAYRTYVDPAVDNPDYERASRFVRLMTERENYKQSTALRQIEVAFGAGGIMDALDCIESPMPRNGAIPALKDNALTAMLTRVLVASSDGLLAEFAGVQA